MLEANVGIIAGIVCLGFELQQNQLISAAATRNNISVTQIQLNKYQGNQELANIVLKATGMNR